jgi:hypothetical protein
MQLAIDYVFGKDTIVAIMSASYEGTRLLQCAHVLNHMQRTTFHAKPSAFAIWQPHLCAGCYGGRLIEREMVGFTDR